MVSNHPDTGGQTTSRLDDPQLHTHLVVSAKVQTDEGRWLALDARVLKQHQRALGGLYQSVLRAELTDGYGVAFSEIVNGQAEIAGVPTELIDQFSKRSAQVKDELQVKVAGFRQREGRHPTRFEHAALEREAAADTRARKTGNTDVDLPARWRTEAAGIGITAESLGESIHAAARATVQPVKVNVAEVIEDLSEARSAWHRMDILRTITDGCVRSQVCRVCGGHNSSIGQSSGSSSTVSTSTPRVTDRADLRMAGRCGSNPYRRR